LIRLYYARIVDYFGEEAWQQLDQPVDTMVDEAEALSDEDPVPADEDTSVDPPLPASLQELLDILLLGHAAGPLGFIAPFLLVEESSKLPYSDESGQVSSGSVRKWLRAKWESSEDAGEPYPPPQATFRSWVTPPTLEGSAADVLALNINARWDQLNRAMRLARSLDSRVQNGRLGVLEIRNTSHSAERKIFEIINAAGTPLTAVEILSARHAWNRSVEPVSDLLSANVQGLYSTMGLPSPSDVVRWDVAATVMDRLPIPFVFGALGGSDAGSSPTTRAFERRVTLGFKILAGWYTGVINKDAIDQLPAAGANLTPPLPWGSLQMEQVMVEAMTRAFEQPMLRVWHDWRLSLADNLGDAVALNFLLILTRDYVRKGRPSAGADLLRYRKNARTELDRLVFEYVTGVWRGSGDSRIASNLKRLGTADPLLAPVPSAEWKLLVEGVVDRGEIRGLPYTTGVDRRITLLLLYRNVVCGLKRIKPGVVNDESIHIDHIVPQELFSLASAEQATYQNHIVNLSPLPGRLNLLKRNRTLVEIDDAPMQAEVAAYELIPEEAVSSVSTLYGLETLAEVRGDRLKADLTTHRQHVLDTGDFG